MAICTQLENLVNMPSTDDASGHRQMLNTLNDSLITHHEALALFLAHPTRRLLDLLMTAVVQGLDVQWPSKVPN